MKTLLVILVTLVSTTSFALDCFNASFARSWKYNADTRILTVQLPDADYEVEAIGCYELQWAHYIGFKTAFGSSVCANDRVVVGDSFGRITQVCPIAAVTKK